MGGPKIPLRLGRQDATGPDMCHPEGNLPAGAAPWPSGGDAAGHIRAVFHRMGLTDEDIVALSGAHTVGRAHADRSGLCHKPETKYTAKGACPAGTQNFGGASWTPKWTEFSNDYFKYAKEHSDPELLVLDTDAVLFTDPGFKYDSRCIL
jgi:L-ascorbate peroxidase